MNRSRRRILGAVAASSLLAAPLVRAQSSKVARVVVADSMPKRPLDSFREALAAEGFREGNNLRIEQVPLLNAPPELAESRAREIIASRPDVIFMLFGPETVLLKHLTRDIPIVFHNCPADPARGGLIASTAVPGANITGSYNDFLPLIAKRWSLYREVLPSLKRGAWIAEARMMEAPRWQHREAAEAYAKGFVGVEREATAIAQRELGIRIDEILLPGEPTEEQMVAAIRRVRPEALRLVIESKANGTLEKFLISERILSDLVVRAGSFPPEAFRAAIEMVVRILRGTRPAAIPAFQGTRYTVKVNPTLAKEMGITIPQSVLLQAATIEDGT